MTTIVEKKKCTKCRRLKNLEKFNRYTIGKDGLYPRCKSCVKIQMAAWYLENPELKKANASRYHRKFRDEIFNHYGQICKCCGETERDFLTLDHVGGGGAKHRKEVGIGIRMYRWTIKNKFPKIIRILCMNCNFATRYNKICPHKRKKIAA